MKRWTLPLALLLLVSACDTGAEDSTTTTSTTAARSAHSSLMRSPVMYSARFSACVPMSPRQPAAPLRAVERRRAALGIAFVADCHHHVLFSYHIFELDVLDISLDFRAPLIAETLRDFS